MTNEFFLALGKQSYWYSETRKFEKQTNPDVDEWKKASKKWKDARIETETLKRKLGIKHFYEVKHD